MQLFPILVGVACLTVVVLMLIGVLLFAESRLVNKGLCKIEINGDADRSPEVAGGGTLLGVLSGQSIFLPSACGGGTSCRSKYCQ